MSLRSSDRGRAKEPQASGEWLLGERHVHDEPRAGGDGRARQPAADAGECKEYRRASNWARKKAVGSRVELTRERNMWLRNVVGGGVWWNWAPEQASQSRATTQSSGGMSETLKVFRGMVKMNISFFQVLSSFHVVFDIPWYVYTPRVRAKVRANVRAPRRRTTSHDARRFPTNLRQVGGETARLLPPRSHKVMGSLSVPAPK